MAGNGSGISARLVPYSNINQDFAFLTVRGDVQARAGRKASGSACPGYAKASSGGPFLTDISRVSGLGTIVGGYQHGGSTSPMPYPSPFGGVLHKLYGSMTRVNVNPGSEGLAALGGNLARHDG